MLKRDHQLVLPTQARAPGFRVELRGTTFRLVATGACAIHCRYCFRRAYPYFEGPKSLSQWDSVIEHIGADPSIEEVLLSGGDPLTLVDQVLAELVNRLEILVGHCHQANLTDAQFLALDQMQ